MKIERLMLLIIFGLLLVSSSVVVLLDKSVADKLPYTLLAGLSGMVFGYYFDTGNGGD